MYFLCVIILKKGIMATPYNQFGSLRKKAKLLKHFNKIENTIVAPLDYFSTNNKFYKRELIVTPYFYQARAISNIYGKFIICVPEPEYHYVELNKHQESVIKTCIIAKLVSSFDIKNNLGISDVQVISGDFILEKGSENLEPTVQNIDSKINLISIRNTINCTLNEYIDN